MKIHVDCPCGQPYEFDIEPENGVMPCAVNCPTCGADGTQLSNEFIANSLAAESPVAPAAPPAPGLRLRRSESPAAELPPASAPPPTFEPIQPAAPKKGKGGGEVNVPLGIVGAVVAGAVAMVGWYFLTIWSESEWGIVAWFVGVMTGIGARIFAKGGSPSLGATAAVCAALAILGADFLVASAMLQKVSEKFSGAAEAAYDKQLALARQVVALKTDEEVNAWFAQHYHPTDGKPKQDVETFRRDVLPKMQKLVDGRTTKQDFVKEVSGQMNSFSLKFRVFKDTLSAFTILWLFLGISSAYRIGSK